MKRDDVIEKIKKLLRMKRGGTPDEITTALRLAQELAEKHGIDLDTVNPDEQQLREKPIGHEDEACGTRISWESRYSGLICNQFFKVRVFQSVNDSRTKYVFRFVGEEWDRQIAVYVYRFLCGHFRREWKTKHGRVRNRQAFMWGMYLGICQKLDERQPKGNGIVLVDQALTRRNAYIKDNFGELGSTNVRPDDNAEAARRRGWMAGKATEIRSSLAKPAAPARPALPPLQGQMALL
jgi:hypothetical protein